MPWKEGSPPPNTWGYGGVTLVGESRLCFRLAEFLGDAVRIWPGLVTDPEVIPAHDVSSWCNDLMAPSVKDRAGNETILLPLARKKAREGKGSS